MASIMCLLVAPVGAQSLFWDFEEPAFPSGPLHGQQGWTSPVNVDENWLDPNPAYVLAGQQSVMAYMGINAAAKYTLNSFPFTETDTQLKFLAASFNDYGVNSTMHVYMNDTDWAAVWMEIFMDPAEGGIYAWSGQAQAGAAHPRTKVIIGEFWYDHIYSFTVGFNFADHTYTVAVENLTDPLQVLAPKTMYMSEYYYIYPITQLNAGISTLELVSQTVASGGLTRDMWDNVGFDTIPEPSALLALGSGLVALAGVRFRRRR